MVFYNKKYQKYDDNVNERIDNIRKYYSQLIKYQDILFDATDK